MPTRPRVKICGITNLPDAELAIELGAWALGMIFYEGSPRRCSPAQAQAVAAATRRHAELAGVYVNAPLEQIVRDADQLELTLVQLHGDEGPSFCAEVARRTGVRVIKAAQVSGAGDIRDLERFHVDFHLLDARAKTPGKRELRGGTGERFDWTLISTRRSKVPLILSGGLDAENVEEAIGLVHPFAVDSASGTESAPGHKDPQKLRAFFEAVAAVEDEPAAADEPTTVDNGSPASAEDVAAVGGSAA